MGIRGHCGVMQVSLNRTVWMVPQLRMAPKRHYMVHSKWEKLMLFLKLYLNRTVKHSHCLTPSGTSQRLPLGLSDIAVAHSSPSSCLPFCLLIITLNL